MASNFAGLLISFHESALAHLSFTAEKKENPEPCH